MLWAVFTLIAAAAQTARNAMQRELTTALGTVGATHVRFLFGFPFALVFLAAVLSATGTALPEPPHVFWPWVLAGAFTQIAATATMLSVMGQRSFVVAYAYIKTEPIPVALFGLLFLGDKITPLSAAAILIATAGVIVISPRVEKAGNGGALRSTVVGLVSGALFGLSAIGYRGAILSLQLPNFVVAATFTVTVGLIIQAAVCRSISRCGTRRFFTRSPTLGGLQCLPVSWVLSLPNSGFSLSLSRQPPMCALWH